MTPSGVYGEVLIGGDAYSNLTESLLVCVANTSIL